MQAIQTEFLGATKHRGSRVKATAAAGSLTLSWDSELTNEGNHRAAAEALMEKLDWNWGPVTMSTGPLKDGSFVHVFQYAGRNMLLAALGEMLDHFEGNEQYSEDDATVIEFARRTYNQTSIHSTKTYTCGGE